MKNFIKINILIAGLLAGTAQAAVCTSLSTGNWSTATPATRWSCGHVPLATDSVVIAHNITVNVTPPVILGLTVNAGVTLSGGNRNLRVGGPVIINGIYNTGGGDLTTSVGGSLTVNAGGTFNFNGGNAAINGNVAIDGTLTSGGDNLQMTGTGTTLSGTGNIVDTTLEIDATGVSVPAGANLIFDANSEIDVAANVNPADLTVNGTIDGTAQAAGDRIIRVSTGGTLTVATTGVINAPNSQLNVRNGATATNNGTITIRDIISRAGTTPVFTQGANSTLNVSGTICAIACTFNASAAGNVVNYTGTAQTVYNAAGSTYANLTLSGSGAKTVPTGLTVAENFTMSGTTTVAAPLALAVGGDFTIGAGNTFTPGLGTVTLNGAAVQTISGTSPLNFNNLAVTNAANPNLTLTTNVVVNGTLSGTVNLSSTCPTDFTLTSNGGATVAHGCQAPSVTSINTNSANPTNPATVVTWTVIFNQSVTGVDTADFALVLGGGVTGASITGVAGGGTTWTVTANTGSGTGTLGLNLVDNDSIVSGGQPLGGPGAGNGNFTGQVYTVETLMTCITDTFSTGTLDTSLWTVRTIMGAFTPQVVNVGGGDYRLRLTDTGGNEATFAQLTSTFPGSGNKVVMEIDYFAYGGTGADGIAVTFSDSTVSSTTGGFGGSLGYAPNGANDGFGGGWLGIGLDEYGNFPNPTEGRSGYPVGWTAPATANAAAGFYKTNVSVRGSGSGATGYSLLANTGVLATAVAPPTGAAGDTPYRFRFTLDHSDNVHAYVTVERDTTGTGGSYTTLVPQFDVKGPNSGQSAVPANWLVSFTGSTGGATNNHDFKRVRVCANTIVLGSLDHLEIQHSSGAGLTCASNTLTVKACADAACTSLYTGGVSGTLDATGTPTVNWDGTTGGAAGAGFVIPSGSSSVTKDVQVATAGSVVFGINTATASPVPPSATTCSFGSPVCTFTADTAGFIFSASATGSGVYTIPTLTSGTAQDTTGALWLRAVKASTADAAVCTPAIISQTVDVDLGYNCDDPNSCQAGSLGNINGTAIAAGGTAVSLAFDVNGSTPITSVRYDDAGQITLTASKTFLPFISGTNVSLSGNSNTFVVKPHHFELTGIQQTALPNLVNPAAANALGSAFVAAGEEFSVTVTAKNALNADTKNFGREIAPESVKLTSTLAAGLGLSNNPALGGTFGAFTDGVASADGVSFLPDGITRSTPFTWQEVGIITLTPSVADADYLGAGEVSGTASGNVGRFFPHHFDTTVIAPMGCAGLVFATACPGNGLVYEVQPYTANAYARSASGGTTQNYAYSATPANNFANAVTLSAVAAAGGAAHGTGSLTAGTSMPSSGFAVGLGTLNTPEFTFTASPDAPSDVFIRANDGEASSLRAVAADSIEGGLKAVSGRIKVSNAHGSEQLRLPIFATVQYYDGLGWVTSSTDNATSFDTTVALTFNPVKAPLAAANVNVVNVGVVNAAAGIIPFTLAVPGVTGSADISIPTPPFLTPATGRITFGVYKGANQFIYMREAY